MTNITKQLAEALAVYAGSCDATDTSVCGYEPHMCCQAAKQALSAYHSQAEEKTQPIAWMDDGTTRNGSDSVSYRVITDVTKRGMPSVVAAAYMTPLYAAPHHTQQEERKPLTYEQVDELSREMVRGEKSVNWLCRAIEAAHHIK